MVVHLTKGGRSHLTSMNIAVLTGGDSSEKVISLKSAEQVQLWLEKAGHTCYRVMISGAQWMIHHGRRKIRVDKNLFGFRDRNGFTRFDFAWNIIHGTPGEDGKLQGYLDMMGIPYSSSGHLSSALTFNKYACKTYMKQHQVLTPEARLIKKGVPADLEAVIEHVGLPCFVKPNNGGSSFGISRVNRFEQLQPAMDMAFREDSEVIIERYIKGTEVTCGVVKTREGITVLPVTEIVSSNDFFDYEAKYTPGRAEEITPARIDEDLTRKCQEMAFNIYELAGCAGIVRVDFIIKGNQVYLLELNSIPGMTRESIIPKQVRSMDLKMEEVLQMVIDEVTARRTSV